MREKNVGEKLDLIDAEVLHAEIEEVALEAELGAQHLAVQAVQRGRRADEQDFQVGGRMVAYHAELLVEAHAVGERRRLEGAHGVEPDEQHSQTEDDPRLL